MVPSHGGDVDFGTRRVLVTGAAGWLGSRLVETLTGAVPVASGVPDGAAIRCLVRTEAEAGTLGSISDRVEPVLGDLRRREDCDRFCAGAEGAVLFHCAGVIHPHRVREFYEVNVDGTTHVVNACVAVGARRAVIVSSNSPCGTNRVRGERFDEASPYRPYMNYGRSKMQMEQQVRRIQAAGSIETVVIRAPWFYGPRQPARQTQFFTMIRDGKAPIVGDGGNLRSMAYVDNLCDGLIRAASTAQANGRTYWIADERPYPMNEIVDTVEALLEREFGQRCAHTRMRLPGIASEIALGVDGALQSLGLYHQKIHVLSEMNKNIACSVDRATQELGYRPAVALEEGMRRSLKWCFDHGHFDA
jgi:nucleoside-diphosphate-sugar epimerase